MKHGKSLQELAVEIKRQQDSKRDFLTEAKLINPFVNNDRLELGFPIDNDLFTAPLTKNGHIQLGQLTDIPKKYYDKMLGHPGLLANNVKHWLERSSDRRMIRSLDGNIRAILSDKYRRLDNFDLSQQILPMLFDVQAEVESCEITENKLYIKAVTHRIQAEIKRGDIVSAGIIVSNSETGHGSLSIKPLVYRLVCSNGMIADDHSMKKYHVGRVSELESIEFQNDTLLAEDTAFWKVVRDTLKHSLNEVSFNKIVEKMKDSTERQIAEPVKAIELVTKKFVLSEEEKGGVLNHLISGHDLSSWGLANAVTRTAQDVESYDRSTELESIGYHVMNQSWN